MPNFIRSSPLLDIYYNPKPISTENHWLPSITNLKVDEILDKNRNISSKDISPNENQVIIKKLFLQMRDKATCKKITERAVTRTYKFFLYLPK